MVSKANFVFKNKANEIMHLPKEWWDDAAHPQRNNLLKNVIGEFD